MSSQVLALAATDTTGVLSKVTIERRAVGVNDVAIEIQYAGICHSDLHQIRGEWPQTVNYPMVPGHEIAGKVTQVGAEVTDFKVGQLVGVGCMVDSCQDCKSCDTGFEQYCNSTLMTYNAKVTGDKVRTVQAEAPEGVELMYGGYSEAIVVDKNFVVPVPENMDIKGVAPLLCAGVTMYSPLTFYGAKAAKADFNVAILGFGGLGHMGAKLSVAMQNNVTVITRNPAKRAAVEALGASFLSSKDPAAMQEAAQNFDLIIDTIPANHDVRMYLNLLKPQSIMCLVGIPPDDIALHAFDIVGRRLQFVGSCIGGIKETADCLQFCADHNLVADVDVIDATEVNKAMYALSQSSSSSARYVIDVQKSLKPGEWQVATESKIDPSSWRVHPRATIVPESARASAHKATRFSKKTLTGVTAVVATLGLGALAYLGYKGKLPGFKTK